jgi:hypothetical protein
MHSGVWPLTRQRERRHASIIVGDKSVAVIGTLTAPVHAKACVRRERDRSIDVVRAGAAGGNIAERARRYLLIGIMMCAPAVPGSISHGTPWPFRASSR